MIESLTPEELKAQVWTGETRDKVIRIINDLTYWLEVEKRYSALADKGRYENAVAYDREHKRALQAEGTIGQMQEELNQTNREWHKLDAALDEQHAKLVRVADEKRMLQEKIIRVLEIACAASGSSGHRTSAAIEEIIELLERKSD